MDSFSEDILLTKENMLSTDKESITTSKAEPVVVKRSLLRPPTKASASLLKSQVDTIPLTTNIKEPAVIGSSLKRKLPATQSPPPVTAQDRTRVAKGLRSRIAPNAIRKTTSSSTAKSAGTMAAASKIAASKTKAKSVSAAEANSAASFSSSIAGPPAKKRSAWDYKGRLQDLESFHVGAEVRLAENHKLIDTMTDQLKQSQQTIHELIQFKSGLESTVDHTLKEKSSIADQLDALRHELKKAQEQHELETKATQSKHSDEIKELEGSLSRLQIQHSTLQTEMEAAKQEKIQLLGALSAQKIASLTLETQVSTLKVQLGDNDTAYETLSANMAELKNKHDALVEANEGLESRLREEESVRRQLHNTIQELKGNIRVFCRVRPIAGSDLSDPAAPSITHMTWSEDSGAIELVQSMESADGKAFSKSYPFEFDRIFPPNASQDIVFEEISQLVQSALDGYSVCVFAYGQTGAGKSYTMEGPAGVPFVANEPRLGMIPRSVLQIYECAEKLKEKGWTYTMEAQYLEIYNETLRDLLADSGSTMEDACKKLDIKHNPTSGRTTVTDACVLDVVSAQDVFRLLARASKNRAVAATECNERSSRSHSIFTLRLEGRNEMTHESSSGILNLIDLAGSERLSVSKSSGDRLKETQAINKSLSSLGDVIVSLSNKDAHIPYRNSKLTYLLQNSLGGNSKTLMFVNVAPEQASFNETMSSLRFATKVNSCSIGTATRRTK